MPTGRDHPERLDELSAEEARQYLIRFLGRQDLDEHADIYFEPLRVGVFAFRRSPEAIASQRTINSRSMWRA